jgi:hypothetical protein
VNCEPRLRDALRTRSAGLSACYASSGEGDLQTFLCHFHIHIQTSAPRLRSTHAAVSIHRIEKDGILHIPTAQPMGAFCSGGPGLGHGSLLL